MDLKASGGRVESLVVKSRLLDRRCNVFIYRPRGWMCRRDAILYLLHGMYGTEADWVYKGSIEQTADRLIDAGQIRRMAIVMPNDGLSGDGTFYSNWQDGTGRFEDYIISEVLRQVETALGGRANRSRRAIAGLSMGGFGAVVLALRHPGMFCAAASLSGAFWPPGVEWFGGIGRRIYGPIEGRYRMTHAPGWLLRHRSASRRVALHFNCGKSDPLIERNRLLHRDLAEAGVRHEYVEFAGAHDWRYWSRHVVEVLEFVSGHLKGAKRSAARRHDS
jgi:S-formylglutathione hydrolase FrmB